MNILESKDLIPLKIVPLYPKDPQKAFLIYNVLSPEECQHLMGEAERIGMEHVECQGYRRNYRNNMRLQICIPSLSSLIWDRVKNCFENVVLDESNDDLMVPVGASGRWKPFGLNESFRFCRYDPGGHFAPHFDGDYVRDSDERSLYTFMLYLNHGFTGGTTNFISGDQQLKKDSQGRYTADVQKVLFKVQPEAGMALVFRHPILHEGEPVLEGLKYIQRSDVMYIRESKSPLTDAQEKAVQLLRKAEELERSHRGMEAIDYYRRAVKLDPTLEGRI
eukprot:Rmarinus@m.27136